MDYPAGREWTGGHSGAAHHVPRRVSPARAALFSVASCCIRDFLLLLFAVLFGGPRFFRRTRHSRLSRSDNRYFSFLAYLFALYRIINYNHLAYKYKLRYIYSICFVRVDPLLTLARSNRSCARVLECVRSAVQASPATLDECESLLYPLLASSSASLRTRARSVLHGLLCAAETCAGGAHWLLTSGASGSEPTSPQPQPSASSSSAAASDRRFIAVLHALPVESDPSALSVYLVYLTEQLLLDVDSSEPALLVSSLVQRLLLAHINFYSLYYVSYNTSTYFCSIGNFPRDSGSISFGSAK